MPKGIYKHKRNQGFQKGYHPKTEFKKGYKQTEETKRKMSEGKKGHITTKKTRKKIGIANSIALKGKYAGEKSWNYIDGRSYNKSPYRYGDDWEKIRYLVYVRDRFTCQHCGINKVKLDVHHIIPFLETFDNSLGNLISLCRKCHMKEEQRLIKLSGRKNL